MLDEDDMQLDHSDDDPTVYIGYSHRSCNAKAGALKLIQKKERAFRIVRQAEEAGIDLSKFEASGKVGKDRLGNGSVPAPRNDLPPPPPQADPVAEGWWIQQPRVSGEEKHRLLGEWSDASERWHEVMREAIRLDDGEGGRDGPVKVAAAAVDAAEVAYYEASGVRTVDGRRQHWNGKGWIDVGVSSWW